MLDFIIGYLIEIAKMAFIGIPSAIIGLILIILMWTLVFYIIGVIGYCIHNIYCWLFKNSNV